MCIDNIKKQLRELIEDSNENIDNYSWVAVDRSGLAYLYEDTPIKISYTWNCNGIDKLMSEIGKVNRDDADWEDLCFKISDLMEKEDNNKEYSQECDISESNIKKVVNMFNELTGHNVSVEDGIQFMLIYNQVKDYQNKIGEIENE